MYSAILAFRSIRVTVAISLAAAACPSALAAEPETLETVLAAWRKREAAAKSLKVVTAEEKYNAANGGSNEKAQRTVLIDGVNIRNERRSEKQVNAGDKAPTHLRISVLNGEHSQELMRTVREEEVLQSIGWIRRGRRHADVGNIYLIPVLFHFRPLAPAMSIIDPASLTLVATDAKWNGERTILLEQPKGIELYRYWVSPAKDMAIVRHARNWKEHLSCEVAIEYRHDAKHAWVPSKWSGKTFANNPGELSSSGAVTVTELELNRKVPAPTFTIDFPPDTRVNDRSGP